MLGEIVPFGSPLNLMIKPKLGDELLAGAVLHPNRLDDTFVIVQATPKRCEAIKGGIELVGERKIGRKTRTRITKNMPRKPWRWT
jgi:hypothetical protein